MARSYVAAIVIFGRAAPTQRSAIAASRAAATAWRRQLDDRFATPARTDTFGNGTTYLVGRRSPQR